MSAPSWLHGARIAPSAHNTQPWLFEPLADGRMAVRWVAERALPVADPTSRDLYLGLGAAVESACLRAAVDGAPLQFEPAPQSSDTDRVVGWLVPASASTQPDPLDLALATFLDKRQTARGPHLPGLVPADVQATLVAEAERHGRRLQIVTDHVSTELLSNLAGRATSLLFADAAVHAELWRWLRLDPSAPAYQRDGLTADCLELAGPMLWLARQLMPPARMRKLVRLRLHQLLGSDTATVARQSAAICLLSSPSGDRAALVETGRVLQRLWLLAAGAGLTTHPLSALLDRPETLGPAVALFADRDAPVGARLASPAASPASPAASPASPAASPAFPAAIFRLGYSAPAARSPRLPLDELWLDGRTAQD